jgi:hypothetical protein
MIMFLICNFHHLRAYKFYLITSKHVTLVNVDDANFFNLNNLWGFFHKILNRILKFQIYTKKLFHIVMILIK